MAAADQIVVDVSAPRNRDVFFPPMQKNLRGERRFERLSSPVNPNFIAVGGFIPGMRLIVDTKSWKWKLIDRLRLDEHKTLRESIVRQGRANERTIGNDLKTEDDVGGIIAESERATWMWWIRRCVDRNRMILVSGNIPEEDAIRAMGDVNLSGDGGLPHKAGAPSFNELPQTKPGKTGATT